MFNHFEISNQPLPKWLVGPARKPAGIEPGSYLAGRPGGYVVDSSGGRGKTLEPGNICDGGLCISAGAGAVFVRFGAVDVFSGFSFFWWCIISQAIRTCIAFHRPGFYYYNEINHIHLVNVFVDKMRNRWCVLIDYCVRMNEMLFAAPLFRMFRKMFQNKTKSSANT